MKTLKFICIALALGAVVWSCEPVENFESVVSVPVADSEVVANSEFFDVPGPGFIELPEFVDIPGIVPGLGDIDVLPDLPPLTGGVDGIVVPNLDFDFLLLDEENPDEEVEGSSGFTDLSDNVRVYAENIIRWRDPLTGGYSYQGSVEKELDSFDDDDGRRFFIDYRLGDRPASAVREGVQPNGRVNPAFAIPTTFPTFGPASTLDDSQVESVGLKRLYLFRDLSGKDYVFSAGQEAIVLLENPNYINISRGVGVGERSNGIILDDGAGSDMYIFKTQVSGTLPMYRYKNVALGVRFHAIGPFDSNEGSALVNLNSGWEAEGNANTPIGYVYPKVDED